MVESPAELREAVHQHHQRAGARFPVSAEPPHAARACLARPLLVAFALRVGHGHGDGSGGRGAGAPVADDVDCLLLGELGASGERLVEAVGPQRLADLVQQLGLPLPQQYQRP